MIQIKNIKKSYQDFLLDCSLTIEKGSVTGIIGKNGNANVVYNLFIRENEGIQLY